jgi:hypothetical protein
MSTRKKRSMSDAQATRRLRSAEREFRKSVGNPDAFFAAINKAAALMLEVRSIGRRGKWKPVTFKQVLDSIATALIFHLSSFTYRKRSKAPQARVARILAALTVRLADTVTRGGTAMRKK